MLCTPPWQCPLGQATPCVTCQVLDSCWRLFRACFSPATRPWLTRATPWLARDCPGGSCQPVRGSCQFALLLCEFSWGSALTLSALPARVSVSQLLC